MRDKLDPIVGKKIAIAYENHCRTWELALKAKLKIGVGTDFFPGPDNAMEMELLVDLGHASHGGHPGCDKDRRGGLVRDDIRRFRGREAGGYYCSSRKSPG